MATGLDNLEIYKLAEELEIKVYRATQNFPAEEKYRSVDQLRRSSASVSDNIAEGYGRFAFGDKINKFYIARGEAEETRKGIEKAQKKGFISEKISAEIADSYITLIKGINGYIKFLYRQQEKKKKPSTQSASWRTKHPSTCFTLIELLVSIGIIVVVVMAAAGIYLNVIGARQKSLGQLNMQEDAQYIMSLMVKDIRENKIDYEGYGGNIASPAAALYLINFDSTPTKIRYIKQTVDSREVLQRCVGTGTDCDAGGNYYTITMTNLNIERLNFYISPQENPFTAGSTTYEHPRVTVVLRVKSLIEKVGEAELVFQQTAPQRYELKK